MQVWLLLLLALLPWQGHAQVTAQLVAADTAAQPGHPLTVALHMRHAPHWHSFWKNPGIGLPTKLTWDLPAGWTAGEIAWPVPTLVKDRAGKITGHGYEGELYLPVQIAVPLSARPGETVTLRATARWLMCETLCVPGKQDVTLTLPISSAAPQPNAAVRAGMARMAMPVADPRWQVLASRDASGQRIDLHVAAPHAINDVRFFPAQRFIAYKTPQAMAVEGTKARLTVAVDPDEDVTDATRLEGVLVYTDPQGIRRGLSVDAAYAPAADAAARLGTGHLSPVVRTEGSTPAGTTPTTLSAGLLLLALLGGLILNLMPCVFPVLGIKIIGFVDQADAERRKVTLHGVAFTAGVLLSFWALAGLLALLRAGGQQLGWGFQLQSAPFVFVLSAVMLAFALNLSGVFEFGLRATTLGGRWQSRQGLPGSFFSGVLATVVATPCSAPFLAPALGAALALPTAQSFVVFTLIGLGLALPYLLLSIFPRLVALLPRPGRWMETLKQGMAFLLYATVAYLVWVLAGQVTDAALLHALFALTLLGFALWLYGRFAQLPTSRAKGTVAAVLTLMLLIAAFLTGWPRTEQPNDIRWEPWSAERVAALRAEGRGIYIDFTARWCATCQVNKQVVFGSSEMQRYVKEHNIATLRADWTNSDPLITAELQRWGRSAVPFNLVYRPGTGAAEPVVLPEILTPDIVLRAYRGQPATKQ